MKALWQDDEFVDDNTLTVNINRLRKKLEEIGAVRLYSNQEGSGVYFNMSFYRLF